MHSWTDVQKRLFLGYKQRGDYSRHTSRRIALLTKSLGRTEATRSAEITQLASCLEHLLLELAPWSLEQAIQPDLQEVDHRECTCKHAALGRSRSSLQELEETVDRSTPVEEEIMSPGAKSGVADTDLLDLEEEFPADDSWLVEVRDETGGQGVEENVIEGPCSGRSVRELRSMQDADKDEDSVEKVGKEAGLHSKVYQSTANVSQLRASAMRALASSSTEGSVGLLKDLQTACCELRSVRNERLKRISFLKSRASELNAKKETAACNALQSDGRDAVSNEELVPSEDAHSKEPEMQEQTGPPGWLSAESLESLSEIVHQLEASLAATCQEMEARLEAAWNELDEPPECREAFEAQAGGLDVVALHQRLECALHNAEQEVLMLQAIARLYQQRSALRRQGQAQELVCRDASKQLLSRKADAASTLRKAESSKKRLAKQSASLEQRLQQAIKAWECKTGKVYNDRLHKVCMRLASVPAGLLEGGRVNLAEKEGSLEDWLLTTGRSTNRLEFVLSPLVENVV